MSVKTNPILGNKQRPSWCSIHMGGICKFLYIHTKFELFTNSLTFRQKNSNL